MMRRLRFIQPIALVLAFLGPDLGLHAHLPAPNPARWTVDGLPKKPVGLGTTFSLTLSAHIQPGWHIYALDEPEGGPVPTQIGLAQGDSLTLLAVDEPSPQIVPDAVLRQPTGMFHNEVGFTLRVRAPQTRSSPNAVSHILVRYQSCNDQLCLPPHTESVPLPLKNIIQ